MIRFYVLPIERSAGGSHRGPKYFAWMLDPNPPGLSSRWSMIDYGSIDQAVLAADITQPDHDSLVLNTDIYAFPENLDAIMPQQAQNALTSFLEGSGIPAQWLSGSLNYREVLRTITGMFLFMQRFLAILGYPPDPFAGLTMNTQFQNLPANYQAAIQQASYELNYTWAVAANTTVRVMLKNFADQWGDNPIHMGIAGL